MSFAFSLPYRTFTQQVRDLGASNLGKAYCAVAARQFAVSLIAIFEPIYIYRVLSANEIPHALSLVVLYFGAIFFFFAFMSPVGAALASRFGLKKIMAASIPFLFGYYLVIVAAQGAPVLLLAALALQLVHMMCFWPAFHFFFARAGSHERRGREVSGLMMVSSLSALAGPLIGGTVIALFGFNALFALVLLMSMAMALPFLFVREERVAYRVEFGREIKLAFSRPLRKTSLAFAARGIEDHANMILWPLFLFSASLSFFSIGAVTFVTTLVILLSTFGIGLFADKTNKYALLYIGIAVIALAWLMRVFVRAPSQAFAVNVLYALGITSVAVPFSSFFYDSVAKEGENPYQMIILREIAMNSAKAVFALAAAALLFFNPHPAVLFPLLALVSIGIALI